MEKIKILIFVWVLAAACNTSSNENKSVESDSVVLTQPVQREANADHDSLLALGNQIIEKGGNEKIWNLASVDSVRFVMDDNFINDNSKSRLALLTGMAGGSAGTANNLLLLFPGTTNADVIYAAQVGEIDEAKIKDYNNDGIKDFVVTTDMMWMGECNSSFEIADFKGGKYNILHASASQSFIGCGQEESFYNFKAGDTLSNQTEDSIMARGNSYEVLQKHRILIYSGGKTEDEILKKAKTTEQTTTIKLLNKN